MDGTVIGGAVDVDEFAFATALEDVFIHELRSKVGELFGNNGFYSLNNLKGLAIFVFFCNFVAQNVQ